MGGALRFRRGDDPVAYDFETTAAVVRNYGVPIKLAYTQLKSMVFDFPRMDLLHADALDLELLFRQTLPIAGVAREIGTEGGTTARYIKVYALAQTLILNHMDRHLDLSASYTLRDPQLLLADVHSTMCYAVCCLYQSMHELSPDAASARALHAMSQISTSIVQSMYDNYLRRFDVSSLQNPEALLRWYVDSSTSPHLGSGFYSSSILGFLAYVDLKPPPALPEALRLMRQLRQRVDEIADLFEDIATGLVTYPIAKALTKPETAGDVAELALRMWDRSRTIIRESGTDAGQTHRQLIGDTKLTMLYGRLFDTVASAGVLDECYVEADALWELAAGMLLAMEPWASNALIAIVDLKRALLERLAANG